MAEPLICTIAHLSASGAPSLKQREKRVTCFANVLFVLNRHRAGIIYALSVLVKAYNCRPFSEALSAHDELVLLDNTSRVETDSTSSRVFAEIDCVLVV